MKSNTHILSGTNFSPLESRLPSWNAKVTWCAVQIFSISFSILVHQEMLFEQYGPVKIGDGEDEINQKKDAPYR
jgi:hypothetical protein